MSRTLKTTVSSLVVAFCATATPAWAQICAGLPSFAHYRWQTSYGFELSDRLSARGLNASFGGGSDALFAVGLGEWGHPEGAGQNVYGFGGTVGSDRLIHRGHRVHLCPLITSFYTFGPDYRVTPASLVDVSTLMLGSGALISTILRDDGARQIVPSFGLKVERERTRATLDGERISTHNETFLVAQLGLGFVFHDESALTPQILVPLGDERRSVTVVLRATVSFGLK